MFGITIESFLNRAKENIQSTELLFDIGYFNASANRAYYAAFHAAIAGIYGNVKEFNNDHKKVRGMFCELFINRRKILLSKYKEYLYDLQIIRNLADYGVGVNKKTSKEQLNKSKEFVELLIGVLNYENEL